MEDGPVREAPCLEKLRDALLGVRIVASAAPVSVIVEALLDINDNEGGCVGDVHPYALGKKRERV